MSITDDMCLSVELDDLLNSASTGRWWLIGSAVNRPADIPMVKSQEEEKSKTSTNPEIAAVAEKLGLRTASRQLTFNILVSTPGGPDATASALLKACHTSANSPGVRLGAGAVTGREREMIHMMIKCGFWDLLNNTNLTVEAKSNAGRALGLICLVYNFPLTVLKVSFTPF
ncbi:unnamed protein product [Trichobilharzia regenti]|nr:unnamed protein product [Trichobilharzia regenti]